MSHGSHFAAIGPLYFFHGFQPCLLLADLLLEGLVDRLVVRVQQPLDLLDGEAGGLQVLDLHEQERLLLVVIPVAGELVHPAGLQQVHPVVVPERLGVAAAEPGKGLDGHIACLLS